MIDLVLPGGDLPGHSRAVAALAEHGDAPPLSPPADAAHGGSDTVRLVLDQAPPPG